MNLRDCFEQAHNTYYIKYTVMISVDFYTFIARNKYFNLRNNLTINLYRYFMSKPIKTNLIN